MKKGLILLVLVGLLVSWSSVMALTAPTEVTGCTMRNVLDGADWKAYGIDCPSKNTFCRFDDTTLSCGICCLLDTIYTITNWIFVGVVLLGVIFVSMGAYNIISAAGSADKVTTGRNYIIWAAIGVAVGLAAKAIPAIARAILKVG